MKEEKLTHAPQLCGTTFINENHLYLKALLKKDLNTSLRIQQCPLTYNWYSNTYNIASIIRVKVIF